MDFPLVAEAVGQDTRSAGMGGGSTGGAVAAAGTRSSSILRPDRAKIEIVIEDLEGNTAASGLYASYCMHGRRVDLRQLRLFNQQPSRPIATSLNTSVLVELSHFNLC